MDFGSIIRNNTRNLHKAKPDKFSSVASGVHKRLVDNIQMKKNSRLTNFDKQRNIQVENNDAKKELTKLEERRIKLEKWKREREKKKREEAAKKKKPFVVGIVRSETKFVPPPVPASMKKNMQSQSFKPAIMITTVDGSKHKNNLSPPASKRKLRSESSKTTTTLFPMPDTSDQKSHPQRIITRSISTCSSVSLTTKLSTNSSKVVKPARVLRSQSNKATDPLPLFETKNDTAAQSSQKSTAKKNNLNKNGKNTDIMLFNNDLKKAFNPNLPKLQIYNLQNCLNPAEKKQNKGLNNEMLFNTETLSASNGVDRGDNLEFSETALTQTLNDIEPNIEKSKERSAKKSKKAATPKSNKKNKNAKVLTPKNDSCVPETKTPEQIIEEVKKLNSPRIILSRGKENARKEYKEKLKQGLLDDDDEPEDVTGFHQLLKSNINMMTTLCDSWEQFNEITELPEHIKEQILVAVGQGRLLMSQKLQQFAGLLQRYEEPSFQGTPVTIEDLQGFWDLVFIQINNIKKRFDELDALKSRGFLEPVADNKTRNGGKAKKVNNKKKTANGPAGASKLREMIAATRKAQQKATTLQSVEGAEEKVFQGGFFMVTSPVHSPPSVTTPRRSSMLKMVLSSEAKKAVKAVVKSPKSKPKITTPYAVLKASRISKNITIEGISPLEKTPPQIAHLKATPSRSILKSNKKRRSSRKLAKNVNFKESLQSPHNGVLDVSYQLLMGTDDDESTGSDRPRRITRSYTRRMQSLSPNTIQHLT